MPIKHKYIVSYLHFRCFFIKYLYFPFRGNFLPNINSSYIKQCNFDFESNMYCPIFKVGDVIRFAQQNFTTLAEKVSVVVIFCLLGGGGGVVSTLAFLLLFIYFCECYTASVQ